MTQIQVQMEVIDIWYTVRLYHCWDMQKLNLLQLCGCQHAELAFT